MPNFICMTCGVQQGETDEAPGYCAICEDERQYIGRNGQQWTTIPELKGYIGYAILLALIVGGFQFLLGVLRLGLVVNFLSHPVVNGFANAAAIIIATSQLSKIFGVSVDES